MSKVVRVTDDGLVQWAVAYAEEREVALSDIATEALRSFKEDTESGVPEIRRKAREQTANSVADAQKQGVGACPKRAPGLGHVWAGVKASGDSRNPCKFGCGAYGRQARDENGKPTGPEGYFEMSTRERGELFTKLTAPASVKKWGKS